MKDFTHIPIAANGQISIPLDHSKVIYCNKGAPVWVDYVPSAVLQMTGNKHFCAVGCEDGSIIIYSQAGRR